MWATFLIAAALLIQAPQTTPADPPVHFEISARAYSGGVFAGRGGSMVGIAQSETGVNWFDPVTCSHGASDGPWTRRGPLTPAGLVWTTSINLFKHEGDTYVIEVTARRDGGSSVRKTMTMHIDEWQTVESVPVAPNQCGASEIRLEVAVGAPGTWAPFGGVPNGMGVTAGGLSAGRTGGPRAASGPQPGALEAPWTQQTLTMATSPSQIIHDIVTARPDMTGVAAEPGGQPRLTVVQPLKASYRAEIWLVYDGDDGSQKTQHNFLHLDDAGLESSFIPTGQKTAGGPVLSKVSVALYPVTLPDGTAVLRTVIARVMSRPSDSVVWSGAMDRAIPMPKPGNVISFALPKTSGPELLVDPHFELRIRLSPGG